MGWICPTSKNIAGKKVMSSIYDRFFLSSWFCSRCRRLRPPWKQETSVDARSFIWRGSSGEINARKLHMADLALFFLLQIQVWFTWGHLGSVVCDYLFFVIIFKIFFFSFFFIVVFAMIFRDDPDGWFLFLPIARAFRRHQRCEFLTMFKLRSACFVVLKCSLKRLSTTPVLLLRVLSG